MKENNIRRLIHFCLVCVVVSGLLTLVGCNCNSNGDDDGENGSPPNSTSLSGDIAIVLSPGIDTNGTTSNSIFPVAGSIINLSEQIMPEQVSWTLSIPDSTTALFVVDNGVFSVNPTGDWAGAINLQPGDNQITLAIQDIESSVDLYITYNSGYDFGGTLMLTPDVAYVGEDRVVTATIQLTDTDTDPMDVKLFKVDTTATKVVSMLDDGACEAGECPSNASGDEIAGDNVYTGRFMSREISVSTVVYRVMVGLVSSSDSALSEKSELLTTHHLTDAKLDELLTKQSGFQNQLEIAAEQGGMTEAIESIIAELEDDPDVAQVGKSDGGQGIWIIYNDGVGGVLYTPISNSKGGGQTMLDESSVSESAESSSNRPVDDSPYKYYLAEMANKNDNADVRLSSDYVNRIKSNHAHVIAAQFFDWGEDDDIPMMMQLLSQGQRFGVRYTTYNALGSGSVEHFKNLDNYGVILISSHGDSFYNGILNSWADIFGWNGPFGIVVLDSNMAVTPLNKVIYEDDLKKGRLVLWDRTYGITPTFIETYSNDFPNSLIYMSICRGTWNTSMATAFLSTGAGAFLGYSDYVDVSFCVKHGPPLLQRLLEPEMTLGDVFVPGLTETDEDPAELMMFGAEDLSLEYEAPPEYEAKLSIYYEGGFKSANGLQHIQEWIRGEIPMTIASGDGYETTIQGTGDLEAFYSYSGGSGYGVAHVRVVNLDTVESYDSCTGETYEREGSDYYYLEIEMRNDIDISDGHHYGYATTITVPLDPQNDYLNICDLQPDGRHSTYYKVQLLDP
ncbi:MAG: hypothetical protein GY845_28900 [Planctomycetes bacterium]|nr:hypothetical protein [Planctomycetota bacterium]